jgi:predicted nucleotidyltransferase
MTKRELVARHRREILALAEKYDLTEIRLFGSVARGDENSASDIDFLVRRKPGSDTFLLFDFKEEVSRLLGCSVDVIAEQKLMRPRFRDEILADAVSV